MRPCGDDPLCLLTFLDFIGGPGGSVDGLQAGRQKAALQMTTLSPQSRTAAVHGLAPGWAAHGVQ